MARRLLAIVAGTAVRRGVGRVSPRVREDREALQKLAADTERRSRGENPSRRRPDVPRELVLVIDHTAYHVGQLVLVRRLLGLWKG